MDNNEFKNSGTGVNTTALNNKMNFCGGMLTGSMIDEEVRAGRIEIDPYDIKRLNPNSYNLRLSNKLLIYDCWRPHLQLINDNDRIILKPEPGIINPEKVLRVTKKPEVIEMDIDNEKEGLLLLPGVLYLGSTIEHTHTDYYIPMLEGRSSIGRYGIDVHKTAGFGDIGFNGQWTLEIVATEPVVIYPGMEICQVSFHTPVGNTDILYKNTGRYNNQEGPTASKLYIDYEENRK